MVMSRVTHPKKLKTKPFGNEKRYIYPNHWSLPENHEKFIPWTPGIGDGICFSRFQEGFYPVETRAGQWAFQLLLLGFSIPTAWVFGHLRKVNAYGSEFHPHRGCG